MEGFTAFRKMPARLPAGARGTIFPGLSRPALLAQVDPGRLGLRVRDQALHALVAALPGLLVAAERLRHVAVVEAVHPDHARFEIAHGLQSDVEVAGPDRGGEAIDGIVGDAERFLDAVDLDG